MDYTFYTNLLFSLPALFGNGESFFNIWAKKCQPDLAIAGWHSVQAVDAREASLFGRLGVWALTTPESGAYSPLYVYTELQWQGGAYDSREII